MPAARLTGHPACRNGIGVKQSAKPLLLQVETPNRSSDQKPASLARRMGDGVAKNQAD
jgi:hypothetical protein